MNKLLHLAVVIDLVMVAVCALFARSGFYELFVDMPLVHTARWSGPWTMPKSALSIMFAAAIVTIIAALLLVVALHNPGAHRIARIVEVSAFVIMLGAWVAWNVHFLGTAGRFG